MQWIPTQWTDLLAQLLADLPALPTLPSAAWVGLALLIAVWLGERLQRAGVARTVGYWLCGAGFGIVLVWAQPWLGQTALAQPASPGAVSGGASTLATLRSLSWIFDLALGWVLVELGQRIDLRWLLRNKALAATAFLEYAVTWAACALMLRGLGLAWLPACVAATLAAHSSPVLLSSLLPQWRAEGQVTERALHIGSLNTVLTAITLPIILSLVGAYAQGEAALGNVGVLGSAANAAAGSVVTSTSALGGSSVLRSGLELAQPLWEAVASVAVGFALGWWLSRLRASAVPAGKRGAVASFNTPSANSPERAQWLSILGAVCVAVGLAQWMGAPALIACLALGLSLRRRAAQALLSDAAGAGAGLSQLAQVLMFLVAGASLPWLQWMGLHTQNLGSVLDAQVMVLAALLLLIRLGAKLLVCTVTARWAGLRWSQGVALGMMLQPFSMTGLVFWAMAAGALTAGQPAWAMLSHAVLLMLCVSDVLAPWLMRTVLRDMREVETVAPASVPSLPPESSGLNTQSSTQPRRVDTHLDIHAY